MSSPPDVGEVRPWPHAVLGGLLISVLVVALVESVDATLFRIANVAPFLLVGVVAAAAAFGLRGAVACAVASMAYAAAVLSTPGRLFVYSQPNLQKLLTLAVAMPLVALLVGYLRNRIDRSIALQRSNSLLQARLQEREAAEKDRSVLLGRAEETGRELQQALDNLEQKDARLRLLTDSLPVLISHVSADHRYTFCNRPYTEWFGFDEGQIVGHHMSEVLGEDAYATIRPYLDRAMAGEMVSFETWVEYRNAGRRYIQATYVPDLDSSGKSEGVGVMVADFTERKHREETQTYLSQAGELLGQSLDYETTLRSVAQLAVPRVADWCAVDMLDAQGERKRLAVAHIDPAKVAWAHEMEARYPPDNSAATGVPNVLRTGKPELYKDIPQELLVAAAQDEEHLRIIMEIGFTSAMIVPICGHEGVLGAITFVHTESGRHYTETDLQVAEAIASRAALAIENARLFNSAQEEIRQRRNTEQALRESEELFRVLADSAPVLIWMSSADGGFVYFNRPWLDFTGRRSEQEAGQGWLESVHPEDRASALDMTMEHFHARRRFATEYRLRRKDGMYRWMLVTGVPRYQPDGTFLGFIGSSVDITDRKLGEEEIKRLNEDLEARVISRTQELRHANEELEAFSYSVSHDLRAPLRSISSYSRILKEDYSNALDEEGLDSLNRIHAASQRMGKLIEDMLRFARLAKTEIVPEHLDISAVALAFADELRSRDPARKAVFDIQQDVRVFGDRQLLTIVIENLFENAWKFTSRAPETHISLRAERQDGEVVLEISDNGIGFDPDYSHKLFMPFERLHGQKDFPGTGIGLSNVKRIIERHGGRVWARGEVGKGARFFFSLTPSNLDVPQQSTPLHR